MINRRRIYAVTTVALLGGLLLLALQPVGVAVDDVAETSVEQASLSPVRDKKQIDIPQVLDALPSPAPEPSVSKAWQPLLALEGLTLQHEVEQWLGTCVDCVSPDMPDKLQDLLSTYEQRKAEHEQRMGQLILPSDTQLQDKVAAIKAVDHAVWGEHAMWLHADQYALYDWQLAVDQLNHQDTDMLIASLPDIPSLQSGRQQYEFLVKKIPQLSAATKKALAAQLLNQTEQARYQFLAQTQANQKEMVARYQDALAELEHQLIQQKERMGEAAWQDWRREQVRIFKVDFFAQDAAEGSLPAEGS
ncbi:hypothetical protein [Salinibius halmophilus]|uniref:hypothetical protein n=1 Tax=Salinibius halmophilus TaxID=1853216 RepID=UPI000E6610BA|nr:hypothetical protein [Salinibius halmophilus]